MAKKKGGQQGQDDLHVDQVLQAVVLADSFASRFQPITHDKPKVLLPLVNVPMLDYTLEFLAAGAVREIFVVCHAHADQVRAYLEASRWTSPASLHRVAVHIVQADNCFGAGDAMRHVHDMEVIKSDPFVLVSGDVISNVKLAPIIKRYRERKAQDKRNIMTMLFKKTSPDHRTRSLDDDTIVCLGHDSQLLVYENNRVQAQCDCSVDHFDVHSEVQFRYDLADSWIDVCSPEVLAQFADNFDYQDLRGDFLTGILESEILGLKLHAHIIENEYAARVKDLRTYDSVSGDVIQRWTYPFVPDHNMVGGDTNFTFGRRKVYKEDQVRVARSATLAKEVVLGRGTTVSNQSTLEKCVVGRNVTIGANCTLFGSFIWDDCVIEDGVSLTGVIVCNGVRVCHGATVEKGAVLSYNVVIGPNHTVPAYSLISTSSEKHDEFGDDFDTAFGGDDDSSAARVHESQSSTDVWDESVVGVGGAGRVFVADSDEIDPLLNSIAPDLSALDKREEVEDVWETEEPPELSQEDKRAAFFKEMADTLRRGEKENLDIDGVLLEVSSTRLTHNASIVDFAAAVCVAFFECLEPQPSAAQKVDRAMLSQLIKLLTKWNIILAKFAKQDEDQLRILFGLERACLDNQHYKQFFKYALQTFYNKDTLSEDVIQEWDTIRNLPENHTLPEFELRQQANDFVEWLNDASEEETSSDDDSD